jgi:serine/threonine-protein kinase
MTTADPAVQRSLVGAVLCRRYRLTRKIGDGGMGEVYAADAIEGGTQKLAVKILLPEFLGEPSVLSRFLDEAATCQRLIHPNIVRVFESFTAEDGSPFIVMELLEGVPLSAYTQNGGRVPMTQAVPILQGILAGLAAAHAQHVVHRDLKPENVFLTRDGHGQFHIKVLDFGIAKVMDVAGGMGSKTRTGMLLGTPAYMSPEQIKSAKDVDVRADLWSAGVMFYEMLTGRVAFPAPTEYARLAAVLSTTPPAVETIDPQLMPLAAFLKKALEKDRNVRFQSALEMSRALTAATSGVEAAAASRVEVLPLSRLPDVPSLYVPSAAQASAAIPTAAAAGMGPTAPDTMNRIAVKAPGGTLASPSQQMAVNDPPPQIIVVAGGHAAGETLPSNDLPMLPPHGSVRTGVAPGVVVGLVLGALVAGGLIGFAVARMM